jgi:hypothetical protein
LFSACGHSLQDVKINQEGTLRCIQCQTDHQVILNKPTSFDSKMNFFNIDTDMQNFIKAISKYEGLQDRPPAILYEKLDNYFKERGMPSSEEVKKMPLNDRDKRGHTSRDLLINALSAIKYSDYYEDCNLIGSIYWDWPIPNLTKIRDKTLRHYSITQKCFYKINVRCRISSLGTQFRLLKHLQILY